MADYMNEKNMKKAIETKIKPGYESLEKSCGTPCIQYVKSLDVNYRRINGDIIILN
jgi:hypothetical protein